VPGTSCPQVSTARLDRGDSARTSVPGSSGYCGVSAWSPCTRYGIRPRTKVAAIPQPNATYQEWLDVLRYAPRRRASRNSESFTAKRPRADVMATQMEQLMVTGKKLRVAITRATTQAWWRRMPGARCRGLVVVTCRGLPRIWAGPFATLSAVSERTGEPGPTCSTANQKLGRLPQDPIFWYLDTYPTRVAAEAAKGPRGTVVESLGKVWLFTVAEAGWRPAGGERVTELGPLPVKPDTEYTAAYLESIFDPGMTAPVHTHSGPEAVYTLTGESCLEIPDGVLRERGDDHGFRLDAERIVQGLPLSEGSTPRLNPGGYRVPRHNHERLGWSCSCGRANAVKASQPLFQPIPTEAVLVHQPPPMIAGGGCPP